MVVINYVLWRKAVLSQLYITTNCYVLFEGASVGDSKPSMACTQRTLTAPGQSSDEIHRSKVDPPVFATFLSTRHTLSRCNTAYANSWEVALFYKDTPEGGSKLLLAAGRGLRRWLVSLRCRELS
jgi:hypothetical protein